MKVIITENWKVKDGKVERESISADIVLPPQRFPWIRILLIILFFGILAEVTL